VKEFRISSIFNVSELIRMKSFNCNIICIQMNGRQMIRSLSTIGLNTFFRIYNPKPDITSSASSRFTTVNNYQFNNKILKHTGKNFLKQNYLLIIN